MKRIRLLIADDHVHVCAGLRLVIEQQPDLTMVGEADDGRQAVAMAKSLKPDLVATDSLIADDHVLMRAGLRLVIEEQPDLTMVGEADDGGQAVAMAKSLKPDLATDSLIADDHVLMRAGLRLVTEQQPDLTVVGEADDGGQAVAMAESLKPDLVVMDSRHADESYVLAELPLTAPGGNAA